MEQQVDNNHPLTGGVLSVSSLKQLEAPVDAVMKLCDNEAVTDIELGLLGVADTHLVAAMDDGAGDLATGGTGIVVALDTSIPIGDPSDSDGDGNNGDVGGSAARKFRIGYYFFLMGMVAQVVPGLMQLASNTHENCLKCLLCGISMSTVGCFYGSVFGLLGEVMSMVDCRLIPPSSLKKSQKISLVAAVTFMMVTMTMAFVFIYVAME